MSDSNANDHLRRHYASLTDGELQAIAADAGDLTPDARALIGEEMQRRSVTPAAPPLPDPGYDEFEEQKWVIVGRFRDLPEALLAKGALDSAGIECHLVDDNMVRLDWFISNLLGNAKLVVKPEDEGIAREILAQPIPETISVDGEEEYEQPACPKCGSLNVGYRETDPAAYVAAYVSLPLPLHRHAWRCKNCSAQWEDVPDPSPGDAPVEKS